jgi:hypothetical protein
MWLTLGLPRREAGAAAVGVEDGGADAVDAARGVPC